MTPTWIRARMAALAMLAISGFHALGLLLILDRPTRWFNSDLVLSADWGLHYYHLRSAEGFWSSAHRLWGYNPFHMAGYPSNTFQDLSVKLFELAAIWAPLLGTVQAFKLCILLATACVPWLAFLAFRNFVGDSADSSRGAVVAALLATAYWWNSFPREMFYYGMVGFPLGCYAAFFALSLLYRGQKSDRLPLGSLLVWLLTCALLIPLHVQATTVILLPALVLVCTCRRPRRVLLFGAAGVAAAIANIFWLLPAVRHLGDENSKAIFEQLPIYNTDDRLAFLKDFFTGAAYWTKRPVPLLEKALRVALLVLGTAGIVGLARKGNRRLAAIVTTAIVPLFVVTYFGSFVGWIRPWQPLRFKIAWDVGLTLAAAFALVERDRAAAPGRRSVPASWKVLLLAAGLLGFGLNVRATEASGRMRLRTEFKPPATDVIAWLDSTVPKDFRILFEESGDESGFVYGGVYLSAFIPQITGHQLIGGPINLYNDRHHFAEFHSGLLFKRGIWRFSEEDLRHYFELYNVGAIVAFHPLSVRRLNALETLVTPMEQSGPVVLYRVNQETSWFLSGRGDVRAGLNFIACSEISGDEVVLKYHWVEGLRSNPELRIESVHAMDDPIPFIKIVHPPSDFTLSVGGPS